MPAPKLLAKLPETVLLVSVRVPLLKMPPLLLAELLETALLVNVVVPKLARPPPLLKPELPWLIVNPERNAVTPPSTWNTRLVPPPLTVTPAAGPVMVSVSLVLLSSSWPRLSGIVWALANTMGSKVMVEFPEESLSARATASRRLMRPG